MGQLPGGFAGPGGSGVGATAPAGFGAMPTMFPGGGMPYYGAQSYAGAMGYGSPYAMPYVMA